MIQLRNFTEEIVKRYLKEHLAAADVCQCENCRLDIMAIMLNKLPPHYIVTERGTLFAQLKEFDLQYTADTVVAMEEAVAAVKNKPQHR